MSKKRYSQEFKEEAMKQVIEDGYSVPKVAKEIGITDVTLYQWLKKMGWKSGDQKAIKELSSAELEIKKLKSELKNAKQENEILKKAAAYFAKESL